MNTHVSWNPWHGCTRISEGCAHCYVYRQDGMRGVERPSSECRKTSSYDLPLKRKRDGGWAVPSGSVVMTCFTSDFLLPDADGWRQECWRMMRQRSDCLFCFYTKRIERLAECLPPDWGDGYGNVIVGCTCENQKRADQRLPVFLSLPLKHRQIIVEPMLEAVDLSAWLGPDISQVCAGGESGPEARICDYDWILDLRRQCDEAGVPFHFHQTGARFRKDGRLYHVPRRLQGRQAAKAGISTDAGDRTLALSLREEGEQLELEGL
jgi:protein gp37